MKYRTIQYNTPEHGLYEAAPERMDYILDKYKDYTWIKLYDEAKERSGGVDFSDVDSYAAMCVILSELNP